MDNMNNTNNQNDNLNNINQTGQEEVKLQKVNVGAIIGLAVLIVVILATTKMISDAYTKIMEFTDSIVDNVEDIDPEGIIDTFDPEEIMGGVAEAYSKYSDVEWCDEKDSVKGVEIYIQNGEVYFKDSTGEVKLWESHGTPKKIHLEFPAASAVLLTEEGDVYYISEDRCARVDGLLDYDIVDMAYANNYTHERFFFLTSEGKLIDRNGVPYDQYNFVDEVSIGKRWTIPTDKDQYGYHWINETEKYEIITNEAGYKLAIAKVYGFEDYALLQLTTGKLMRYDGLSKRTVEETLRPVKKVERITTGDKTTLVFTFYEGVVLRHEDVQGIYDVQKKETVDVSSITEYADIPEVPEKVETLSDTMQQFLIKNFDCKTYYGSEVMAMFNQYSNSVITIVLKTAPNSAAYTGKYRIHEAELQVANNDNAASAKEAKMYSGGVYFRGKYTKFDTDTPRTTLSELTTIYGVTPDQRYYSSLIKTANGDVLGVLFVKAE